MLIERLAWNKYTRNITLWILSHLLSVKRGRVMFVSWAGEKYNCNPRAIADELCKDLELFELNFVFLHPEQFQGQLPKVINAVEIGSLYYFYLLSTSQFIIANTRFGGGLYWPFKKKKGQYYIQTMHGGHGMKKQELEVCDSLSKGYLDGLYEDAFRIDLMISDSRFWTEKARTIFAYPKGDILEVGLPRNDIFFATDSSKEHLKEEICERIGVSFSRDTRFLVYCPTFRSNNRRDVYGFDTNRVVAALEEKFGGTWYILISSHPNMLGYYREIYDFTNPRLVDIGAEDLQPVLVVSDAAITDYSSAGFEFALTNNPCFLLCRDLEDYDRGVYFDLRNLPFPFASSDDELIHNIERFDLDKYRSSLAIFNREVIGLHESGHASEAVVAWMKEHIKK